ncbi:MAG: hypothetical protein KGY66_06180 [Candidatus Thermoplasmatota archaeon]|nr:hypothetical protein [Candidatus Thermoplasmatota archaeon]MBS3790486.1 hypothetical protein [Candidatus Thermoplasmatota archaeon]
MKRRRTHERLEASSFEEFAKFLCIAGTVFQLSLESLIPDDTTGKQGFPVRFRERRMSLPLSRKSSVKEYPIPVAPPVIKTVFPNIFIAL